MGGFTRVGIRDLPERGESLVVAPGGTREMARSFRTRYQVDFGKRRGEFEQTPLANTFVSVANAMGVPTKSFADSTGPLEGLV